jgi:cellulose synthase/poly-beta-1,6-N-acetylglucosamine synthase-like glycosyltransferase
MTGAHAGASPSGGADDLPRASVIVAVYNGEETLAPCLDSLLRLDYPAHLLDLVCVDNGSTDATPRILNVYAGRLRVLHEQKRGPAAARNQGVRQSTADVVAFTDADCIVDAGWLRNLVGALRDPDVGVVGGKILSRQPCNRIEAFGERIHDHARALTKLSPPYAITMNWASRRIVLNRIGLFNESLLRSSDVDCSYRMLAAGYRLAYEPRAIIHHRNERTPWGLVHEGYVHGFHAPRVQRLHVAFLRQVRAARARQAGNGGPASDARAERSGDELWWSLFNFGKRIGRLHGAWAAAFDGRRE